MFGQYTAQSQDTLETLWVNGRRDDQRGLHYQPDLMLAHAVNTALALGRPLLMTRSGRC